MEENRTYDPRIQENLDNLMTFIENINCLYDTFEYSEIMLRTRRIQVSREITSKLKELGIGPETKREDFKVPEENIKEFDRMFRRYERSKSAFELIPRSYVVSLVSLFDVFIGSLVKNVYSICPEKLNSSEQKLSFAELSVFSSIEDVKDHLMESKIESILRESHQDQIGWFEKELAIKTLRKFSNWPVFIELTQRRNLFVHSNGKVSGQYLQICKNNQVKGIDKISKGDKLDVSREYFIQAFNVIYEVAVKLSQMVLRCLLWKKEKKLLPQIDQMLINLIFELIEEERYELAIELSEFGMQTTFKHTEMDRIFITLNLAQAYKWFGKEKESKEILEKEDASAWKCELQMAKAVLLDEYEDAIILMHKIGSQSDIFTKTEYRIWPIFKRIREQEDFKKTFEEIFSEPFEIEKPKPLQQPIQDNNINTVE